MMLTSESATVRQGSPVPTSDDQAAKSIHGQTSADAFALLHWHPMPFWKRLFDICIAGLLLVALTPIFVMVGLFIRLVSRGPILFKQKRLGEMGRYFVIYKFRTLHPPTRSPQLFRHEG